MRSNKQWRIQQLIRLAELCDSDEKKRKQAYMDEAENLLFGGDSEDKGQLSIEDLMFDRHPDIADFVERCEAKGYEIMGRATREVYEEYKLYCLNNRIKEKSIVHFSRVLCPLRNYATQSTRHEGGHHRIYVKK